jgi:hypothetical protein
MVRCSSDLPPAPIAPGGGHAARFAGPGVFVGEDGLPFGYLTDEVKTRTILRIQEVVAEAQVRAPR